MFLGIKRATQAAVKAVSNFIAPKDEHEFKEDVDVDVWYPDHAPRTTSNLFAQSRKHVIDDLDTPCYICGSKTNRELHHFHVEWAFAGAVDWDKMKTLYPDFNWATFKTAEDFVDSEYNMMVLCATHHRLKNRGIHSMPYPLWIMQRHKLDSFVMFDDNPDATVLPPPAPDEG